MSLLTAIADDFEKKNRPEDFRSLGGRADNVQQHHCPSEHYSSKTEYQNQEKDQENDPVGDQDIDDRGDRAGHWDRHGRYVDRCFDSRTDETVKNDSHGGNE